MSIGNINTTIQNVQNRVAVIEAAVAAQGAAAPAAQAAPFKDAGVGLVDKKFFEPEPLVGKDVFREWAEEFTEYIKSRDKTLATLLDKSRHLTMAVSTTSLPELASADPDMVSGLYRVLKKLLKPHKDAGPIVSNVPKRCPFEAWRLIHTRMAPLNDQAASNAVTQILDPKKWAVTHITQIPLAITKWEGLQEEHFKRTRETVLTASAARGLLMQMIPQKLVDHIRTNTVMLGRDDLTYDKLKSLIIT